MLLSPACACHLQQDIFGLKRRGSGSPCTLHTQLNPWHPWEVEGTLNSSSQEVLSPSDLSCVQCLGQALQALVSIPFLGARSGLERGQQGFRSALENQIWVVSLAFQRGGVFAAFFCTRREQSGASQTSSVRVLSVTRVTTRMGKREKKSHILQGTKY